MEPDTSVVSHGRARDRRHKLTRELLSTLPILILLWSCFCDHNEPHLPRAHPWPTINFWLCILCWCTKGDGGSQSNNYHFGWKVEKYWGRSRRGNYEITGKRCANFAEFLKVYKVVENCPTGEVKCFFLRNLYCYRTPSVSEHYYMQF